MTSLWRVTILAGAMMVAVAMVSGSALADVRVEGGGASVPPGPLVGFTTSSTALSSQSGVARSSATPDWLPPPEPGRVLAPGETVRTLPVEVWRASLVIPEAHHYALLRITACETGGTWDVTLRGAAGEVGVAQVIPRFWGPVPADLRGQFAQAADIYAEHGDWPWRSTRDGCPIWNAE